MKPNPTFSSTPLPPSNEVSDFLDLPGVPSDLPTHDLSPEGKGKNEVSSRVTFGTMKIFLSIFKIRFGLPPFVNCFTLLYRLNSFKVQFLFLAKHKAHYIKVNRH
jgi:hypothetical protein